MCGNSLRFVFCACSKSVAPSVSNVVVERSNRISVMKGRYMLHGLLRNCIMENHIKLV